MRLHLSGGASMAAPAAGGEEDARGRALSSFARLALELGPGGRKGQLRLVPVPLHTGGLQRSP
jgi:hypothetical protein